MPGYKQVTATHVDHVVIRRSGVPNTLANLRCPCGHTQIKEISSGKRKRNSDGKPYLRGCDGTGKPLDPTHWWNPTHEDKKECKSYL